MANEVKLAFARIRTPEKGVLVVFCDDALKLGAATRNMLGRAAELTSRAARAERFTGKSGTTLDIILPAPLKLSRLTVIGAGSAGCWKVNTRMFCSLPSSVRLKSSAFRSVTGAPL